MHYEELNALDASQTPFWRVHFGAQSQANEVLLDNAHTACHSH
jgi:hypothetical protein